MNKKLIGLFVLVATIWIVLFSVAGRSHWIDPTLEKAIQERYEVDVVTKQLARSFETLTLDHANLTNIDGLRYFENVRELNLSHNAIEDASVLASLPHLEKVDVSYNVIESLSFHQQAAERLVELNAEHNRLTSLDDISPLSNVHTFNVRDNRLVTVEGIERFPAVEQLNVRGNLIQQLEPLAHLENVHDLNVRNNRITSLEPLLHLPLSERLYIEGNPIADYEPLRELLPRIKDVDMDVPIPEVRFKTPTGFYDEPFDLWLTTAPHHKIYYTLDGSEPTVSDYEYVDPIHISEQLLQEGDVLSNNRTSPLQEEVPQFEKEDVQRAIVVTAASYYEGEFGESVTHTYFLDDELSSRSLPILSIAVDPDDLISDKYGIYVPGDMYRPNYLKTGNYYLKGREHEKRVRAEFIDEEGKSLFRQRLGMRAHGNYTRVLPQKSVRLYARSEYGSSAMHAKLFDDVPYYDFEKIIVRNSGNDNASTMLRDGLMQSLLRNTSMDIQAYRPTIVLMNGEYWGLFNLRERYDASYIDKKYGIASDELAMLSVQTEGTVFYNIDVGTTQDKLELEQLMEEIKQLDPLNEADRQYVHSKFDIEHYFRYVAYQVYFGNSDSFMNNATIWKKKVEPVHEEAPYGHDGKYRFMVFDLDWGMGFSTEENPVPFHFNLLERIATEDRATALFRFLMGHEEDRNAFIRTMYEVLNTQFESTHVIRQIEQFASQIEEEIPYTIQRWQNIESFDTWKRNVEALKQFATERPTVVLQQMEDVFNLSKEEIKEITHGEN